MFDQLMRFNAILDTPDSPDTSDKFARLVNALSRLNRAALSFKKYTDLCAKEKAREFKELDPDRDLTDNECAAWARRMDRLFMMPSRTPAAQPSAPTPQPASTP